MCADRPGPRPPGALRAPAPRAPSTPLPRAPADHQTRAVGRVHASRRCRQVAPRPPSRRRRPPPPARRPCHPAARGVRARSIVHAVVAEACGRIFALSRAGPHRVIEAWSAKGTITVSPESSSVPRAPIPAWWPVENTIASSAPNPLRQLSRARAPDEVAWSRSSGGRLREPPCRIMLPARSPRAPLHGRAFVAGRPR